MRAGKMRLEGRNIKGKLGWRWKSLHGVVWGLVQGIASGEFGTQT